MLKKKEKTKMVASMNVAARAGSISYKKNNVKDGKHPAGFSVGFISSTTSSVEAKCIQRERQALLNFKQGLTDYYGMLSTWSNDDNNTDCCKWKGIQCNNQTGHIVVLDLHGRHQDHTHSLSGALNLTSLIHLENIEHLDLSYNDFQWSYIPQLIGSFTNLTYLNLSFSAFGGTIPSKLGNHSKLRFLDLGRNYLEGAIPFQIGNFKQLQHLNLGDNSLSGTMPFQNGNLPILHTLRLAGNFDIEAKDAEWLSNHHSLTNLELSSLHNLSSSRHWLQTIKKLVPNLRELRLVDYSLSDTHIKSLFHSHSNFSAPLTILDLSFNMLTSSAFQFLNFSRNLQELYLSYNKIALSSSLYPNFLSLKILDLSYNNLTSSIFQGSFNFSSKLQELYLQNCSLIDRSFLVSTTSTMNSSSSLLILDLSYNLLKSLTIFYRLFNSTINLRTLYIYRNFLLKGSIPNGFGKIMNSLEDLDLSGNKLQGKIPTSLGNIFTLQRLDLGNNNLSGEISSFIQNSSWCKRPMFHTLDLSNNRITGVLPNLSILASLRNLDLSNNQLTGEIPKSIGLLFELQSLHLEENYLKGDIIESHLTNLSKLEELDLTDNSLFLQFGTTWIPPFQLFKLGLASCKLGPSFPSWLQTQSYLQFLDISDAEIDDFVPDWFWNKLQSINAMNMSYNNLKGTIPNLPIKLTTNNDIMVILNSNQFEGSIPTFLSQVQILDFSKNKISDANTFLCGKGTTTNMFILDLSNNHIMGQLPDCWEHLRNSLGYLDLSNNELSGKIPQSMGTLVYLEALVLRNNSLTGDLPFTLKNCTYLNTLDVSENLLSGPIPSWIGESLEYLSILSLRVNQFFGNVPVHLCYLRNIHVLDLSRNNLSEEIPACLRNFTEMIEKRVIFTGQILKERKMSSKRISIDIYDPMVFLMWKGQEHVYWNPGFLLKSIDLSSNALTGEIPKEVGYLLGLVSLNLSRNNLNGEIPSEIGNLNSLDFLDLSRNHLSGEIPSTLSNIDRLSVLDLSNNYLIGRIPWGRQFQTFDASSFEGNLGLCGKPLSKSCLGDETRLKPQETQVHDEDDNSLFYGALYMSLGVGFFTGFWGLLGSILLWQTWRYDYMRFLNRLTDYILVMVEVNITNYQRWCKN